MIVARMHDEPRAAERRPSISSNHLTVVCGMPYEYSFANLPGYYTGEIFINSETPHGVGSWRSHDGTTVIEGEWFDGHLHKTHVLSVKGETVMDLRHLYNKTPCDEEAAVHQDTYSSASHYFKETEDDIDNLSTAMSTMSCSTYSSMSSCSIRGIEQDHDVLPTTRDYCLDYNDYRPHQATQWPPPPPPRKPTHMLDNNDYRPNQATPWPPPPPPRKPTHMPHVGHVDDEDSAASAYRDYLRSIRDGGYECYLDDEEEETTKESIPSLVPEEDNSITPSINSALDTYHQVRAVAVIEDDEEEEEDFAVNSNESMMSLCIEKVEAELPASCNTTLEEDKEQQQQKRPHIRRGSLISTSSSTLETIIESPFDESHRNMGESQASLIDINDDDDDIGYDVQCNCVTLLCPHVLISKDVALRDPVYCMPTTADVDDNDTSASSKSKSKKKKKKSGRSRLCRHKDPRIVCEYCI